jgi:polyphosphate glucokinase
MNHPPKVLVIDIGGNNVKLLASGQKEPRRFPSGPKMTPAQMVQGVKKAVADWQFEVISIGYPGLVVQGKIRHEPKNLAKGWIKFDFEKAFGLPVRIVNDAAMQAIGSYEGGRMLFLGLGTGLGSAFIADNVLEPMELAHMPYRKERTFEDYVGQRGLDRVGRKKWQEHVFRVVEILRAALIPEYVVLGGGNIKNLKKFPPETRPGNNANAFKGGFRMWAHVAEGAHETKEHIILH